MAMPLPPGEPERLGPFRVTGRLAEAAAGIVYAGRDCAGRGVRLAVLSSGAASDPPARARFRAAIVAAGGLAGAEPDGVAPWAAVWEADGPVVAELLAAALVPVRACDERAGGRPGFAPYWAGSREPAVPGRPPLEEPRRVPRSVVVLAVLAVMLSVLLEVLLACQPSVRMPVSPPSQVWTPPPRPSPVSPGSPSGRPLVPVPSGTGDASGAAAA